MDLSKQIGSLFIIGFPGPVLNQRLAIHRDIVEHQLGGVILFNRCLHDPSQPANISSPEQLHALCRSLQELGGGNLLIGVDQEGGKVSRLRPEAGFTEIRSARDLAESGESTEVTRTAAETTAAMLAEAGINCNFAPVLDLAVNPENPVITTLDRSFSASPEVVSRHARTWIEAHRRRGIVSCVKHFPGHGSSTADSHHGFVDISTSWQRTELEPYRQLLAHDLVEMVMTGHLFNRHLDPHYPATLSGPTIDGLLRNELGYDGVVVSDDLQMKAITDHYGFDEAVCRSLAAGVDMLVLGNNLDYDPDICPRAIQAIRNGIDRNIIGERRLQAALDRVRQLKKRTGIFHA